MTTTNLNRGLRSLGLVCTFTQLIACGSADKAASDPTAFGTANLVGTWKSPCLQLAAGGFETKQIVFTNETFAFTTTAYTESACTKVDNILAGAGTYKLNGSTALATVGNLVNIDYTFNSYTWAFIAKPLLAVDYAKVCDSTSTAGRVDVLGKTCTLDSAAPTVFNSPSFGTLAPEGTTLVLSDMSSNGATEATRSTEGVVLGKSLGWAKQADAVE